MSEEQGAWYWHIHHDQLFERLTASLDERVAFIRETKPADEIETRLRLLRPVQNTAVLDAYNATDRQAQEVYDATKRPAWEVYRAADRQAQEVYDAADRQALEVYRAAKRPAWEAVEALHRAECPDCPWDGKTIFPLSGGQP